jgi:hypothetical protein
LYEIIPVTNQVSGEFVSSPAIRIVDGVNFVVAFNGSGVVRPQALTMTVIRPGEVRRVDLEDLAPEVSSQIRIGTALPVAQVISEPVQRVRIIQTLESNPSSYRFASEVVPRRGSVNVTLRVDPKIKRLVLRNGSKDTQEVTLRLRSRTEEGTASFSVRDLLLPPGGRIIGRFSQWEGPEGSPNLWLDGGLDDGKLYVRVPIQRIAAD